MKTYSAKPADITRKWYLVDAEDVVLGRLASQVAKILRGKHKPEFTPHIDCGDHVVIINAEKIKLTGNSKAAQKTYYRHTGYPGGIKGEVAGELLTTDGKSDRVVYRAIERMISRGKMGRQQMTKLRVYAGAEHPHEAQNPEVLDIAAMNPKNKRSA